MLTHNLRRLLHAVHEEISEQHDKNPNIATEFFYELAHEHFEEDIADACEQLGYSVLLEK